MPLTKKDIQQYVEEKAPNLTCTVCGEKGHWALPDAIAELKAMVHLGTIGARGPHQSVGIGLEDRHLPMIWLVCLNCGHILFLAKKVIDRWKDDNE